MLSRFNDINVCFTDIFSRSVAEGSVVSLFCKNDGRVIWEKCSDRGRSIILRAEGGEITKYKPDPENRYSVMGDLSLSIKSLSVSDSGIYCCNGSAVENLIVIPTTPSSAEIFRRSEAEGSGVALACGKNDGRVIWEKCTDRGRSSILRAEGGEITKYKPDPENRYSVVSDLSLSIKNLSVSDSGIYCCNIDPVVNLTVIPASPSSSGEYHYGQCSMDNVHHPLHSTITRQRSSFSGRLLSQSCSTDRLRKSFVPQAIRLFNSSQHSKLKTL
ncbi:cell wall protein DAN4-like [Astyanax mexicanus]|uniref:Cell wall protein DAN4-like n=1 Tax=Astyanax mexicanus TaxID=7994 RepID=A0A8T2MDM4_ASTMX|nr:cell wall protein DAN4-like [Astyanax mexicanus]